MFAEVKPQVTPMVMVDGKLVRKLPIIEDGESDMPKEEATEIATQEVTVNAEANEVVSVDCGNVYPLTNYLYCSLSGARLVKETLVLLKWLTGIWCWQLSKNEWPWLAIEVGHQAEWLK